LVHAYGKSSRSKEFWDLVETGVTIALENPTPEQEKAAKDSKLLDLKVKNYLFQSIDRTIMETILVNDSAKDILDAMRRKYQGSTKVKRAQLQALRKEFEILAMKEGETIDDYFTRTLSIANKMTTNAEKMDQTLVVEKILRSLTSKFNYVVCSIEESNDVTTLSIDELQSSLLVQEQRMKSQNQDFDAEQALKFSNGGRGSVGYGRGRGRSGARGRGRGRINKGSVECFKCHKLGHYHNECSLWEENANFAEFEDGELLLMAQSCLNRNAKDEVWFLDSGCSNHMIGTKDWLFEFDSEFRESVKLGDDSRMPVMGRGNLKFLIGGMIQVITNVYYLPGLRNNLLSIGQLPQKNLTIVFKKDTCKVYHEERGLIMSTQMSTNRMFIISALVIVLECLKIEKCEDAKIWHQRYGHLSWKGLKIMIKKEMVRDLPVLQEIEAKCKHCLLGKQHRKLFLRKHNGEL